MVPDRDGSDIDPDRTGGLLPEPWAAWVVSLTPFLALLLFFTTGYHWWWFLMIPITGLIVYGPDQSSGHRKRAGQARDRRRNR